MIEAGPQIGYCTNNKTILHVTNQLPSTSSCALLTIGRQIEPSLYWLLPPASGRPHCTCKRTWSFPNNIIIIIIIIHQYKSGEDDKWLQCDCENAPPDPTTTAPFPIETHPPFFVHITVRRNDRDRDSFQRAREHDGLPLGISLGRGRIKLRLIDSIVHTEINVSLFIAHCWGESS